MKSMIDAALRARARKLIVRLNKEQDRRLLFGPKQVRRLRAAQLILNSDVELQMAVIKCAVEMAGRIRVADAGHWHERDSVPLATFDLFRELLRHRLPLTQEDYTMMFQQLARIGLLDCKFIRFEPLVAEAERLAAHTVLKPRLRKAATRLADALLGRNLRGAHARYWREVDCAPRAASARLAARLDRMVAAPLHC